MKSFLVTCLTGCLALAAAQEPAPAPLPDLPPIPVPRADLPGAESGSRVVSAGGNFRVSGGELVQRKSMVLLLEESRKSFEDLLEFHPDPKTKATQPKKQELPPVPIDVVLEGKPGDAPKLEQIQYDLRFNEGGYVLGLRVDLSRGIDREELEHAAITLLLYERSLRGLKPGELEDRLVVKPWLVEGIREAKTWREGKGDWQLYQGVAKAGGGFSMDELFEMSDERWRSLDPSSRIAFRVLSGATAMALIGQPKGEESFSAFINEVARNGGETPVLLRKHFPDLNLSEKSLAKWVQLTLMNTSQPSLTESLSIIATEHAFDDALKLQVRDPDGNPAIKGLDAWKEVAAMKPAERTASVRVAQEALARLSYRCFPSYRDALKEYQSVLTDLAKGDTKKIDQRLLELNEERDIRRKRAERARDYMDYFEITRARDVSGQFDDYIRLKKELDENPRPKRSDRVTKVLDVIEATYEPKKKQKP